MRRALWSCVAALLAGSALPAVGAAPSRYLVQSAGVTAGVRGNSAWLDNGTVRRDWSAGATTALVDRRSGHNYAKAGHDFDIALDGASGLPVWTLTEVLASTATRDPARPAARSGSQLAFRYTAPGGLELDRTVVLRTGSAVFETTSTLVNHLAVPARVNAWTLDRVTTSLTGPAEVVAFHGGSDWRDDYRAVQKQSGAFDVEGEILRLDDGHGRGVVLVGDRRGGVMSRAARTADGSAYVGVDQARDLFDLGPLATDPPDYNRLDNPVYPVPLRSRTLGPLTSLDLGRAFTGVYSGGSDGAAAAFVDDYASSVMPAFRRTIGLNSFHPWNHGTGMSDQNLRKQVVAAKALGVETFMLDDQWQGGPGGESGDWKFDSARYPDLNKNGKPDFVEFLHAHGLQLGLWMSPANFHGRSNAYTQHPHWACAPIGDATSQYDDEVGFGVWDLTNPELRAYLTATVDRLIHDHGVVEFKFDFQSWVDCGAHDYADAEDAFVSLVHAFQVRHPSVTFELDETNDQRLWALRSTSIGPSWFDNGHLHGSTRQAKLLHDLWVAAPWLPTSTIGIGTYDNSLEKPYTARYLMPIALLSHFTFWSDLTKLTAADRAETRWWLRWYAAHRADLGGLASELTTADPIDGTSWMVLQPRTRSRSYVFAFRQKGAATQRVTLRGLDAHRTYRLTDVRTGRRVATVRGGAAVTLHLASAYSSTVLSVSPA